MKSIQNINNDIKQLDKLWEEEEELFLKINYVNLGVDKCTEILKRTKACILRKAYQLKLHLSNKKPYKYKEFLYEQYIINNKNLTQIAEECKTSASIISEWLRKFEISIRDRSQTKYHFVGEKVGELDILSEMGAKNGSKRRQFICNCSCGRKNIIKDINSLLKTNDVNCGNKSHHFVGLIRKVYFNIIKKGSLKRGITFNITIEYINSLFIKQNGRCVYSNIELTLPQCSYTKGLYQHTASLDRIDSSKGYIEGNVQWVHKDINFMKQELKNEVFLHWIDKIYNYKVIPLKEQDNIIDYCI